MSMLTISTKITDALLYIIAVTQLGLYCKMSDLNFHQNVNSEVLALVLELWLKS